MWEQVERAELKRTGRPGDGDLAAGPLPQPSLPPGTDLLPQIKHIVVLMMENHSYDNYLGMLQGRGDGFPLGADGRPGISNPDNAGEPVRAHHLSSTVQRPKVPSQSWHATHHQWDEGKCDGFVTSRHGISWANYHPTASGQSRLGGYVRHKRRMARRRLLAVKRASPR